ncbi:MAG: DegT/DnrJ/EryC1/StrS family aminotransferase [Dehalococcoidales bacterium]|nr:DegT/DnrJ/EryC1/StrS family aminotransferase [Dehalococcoidales bacterium]
MRIPSAKPYFEDIDAILEDVRTILTSGRLILGPYTKKFEELFAKDTGVKYAIATSSCTSAMEISMRYLDVKDREVIVPANTYIACSNSVIYAGGKPVFVDIAPDSYCIDYEDVLNKVTPKAKVVMAVHIGGLPVPEISALKEICQEHGLFLLEDAAHAHGAMIDGMKVGSLGDIGCFSFYPTKIMTTCVGGMITTNNEELRNFAVSLRHHGQNEALDKVINPGGNDWLMDEIGACIGIYQLERLEQNISKRNQLAQRYMRGLDKLGISYYPIPKHIRHGYYKFLATLNKDIDRDRFKEVLRSKHGVEIGVIYPVPLNREPIYESLGYKPGSCPVAEEVLKHQISLPMYVQMNDADVDYVLECLEAEITSWSE